MAELFLERNELDAAAKHLVASTELGGPAGLEQNPYRWRVAMARLRMAEGDLDAALGLLDEADRQYVSHFLPRVRPVAALRARVWLRQGRLADALRWASDAGLSSDDELVYLREFEHITSLGSCSPGRSRILRPARKPRVSLIAFYVRRSTVQGSVP